MEITKNYRKEHDPRTYIIINTAMEVHRILGPGYLEAVYQECLKIEFNISKVPFVSQPRLSIYYKNIKLKKYYIPDFIIYDAVIVEIKAEKAVTKNDEAQIINSLKNSKKKVGLLINFGETSLKIRRFSN